LGSFKDKVTFVQGDIFQPDKISECVGGSEAVFSTVPPEANTKEPGKYAAVMQSLIDALEKNGIKRFIHIGGAAHGGGMNENWNFGRRMLRLFLNLTWKPGLIAKQLEWEVLRKSGLEWTLVRPPAIMPGSGNGKIIADEKNLARTSVYAEDLADFMLDQIESKAWIGKAPLVASVK
jgi:putative NADH-flavin reductase